VGGFVAALIISQIISVGGLWAQLEWGYVGAFVFFIVMLIWKPEGVMGNRA
jgi:branched-chain amino acid transport system permease protein